jgi:hypothetical protein
MEEQIANRFASKLVRKVHVQMAQPVWRLPHRFMRVNFSRQSIFVLA